MKPIDLTGHRYGRLTVVRFVESKRVGVHAVRYWECLCDCGNTIEASLGHLRHGDTSSCGCLRVEMAACKNVTHRRSGTPEHYIWCTMLQRCNNPKNISYKNYGARGITVCERWRQFSAFLEDMGQRPSSDHSIERIDNSAGYSKANCIWTTRKAQSNNRRSNIRITLNGQTHTLKEWSDILGFTYEMALQRIKKLGWDPVRAITEPSGLQGRRHANLL